MKNVRVRFAPSPTGPLHIGGVRTALYNYLFAKKFGGDFLLRIEDTDQSRYVSGAEDYIIKSLKWCNINFDEGVGVGGDCGPYRQSERKSIYEQYVQKLINNGNAYYAFDTVEELEQMRLRMKQAGVPSPQYNQITRNNMKNSLSLSNDEVKNKINSGHPYVIRVKMPRNEEIKINDLIRGWVVVNTNNLDDKVIFKSDGMPTYHLANVVDDNDMKITSVVRGEEWLSSLPVHYLLYEFFGWKPPKFYHLPLILKTSGAGKLSKRDADEQGHPIFAVKWEDSDGFKEHGFIPEGLNNYLALLGWSNKEEKEKYTMEELVESFNYEEINKSGARFDFKKALWINHLHLKDLESKRILDLSEQTKKLLVERYSEPEAIEIIELVKERLNTTKDIDKELSVFIKQPKEIDVSAIEKINREVIFSVLNFCKLNSELVNSPFELKNELMKFGAENDISFGNIMKTLRLSLVGSLSGPDLFKIIDFIGPEETLQRIENLINKI